MGNIYDGGEKNYLKRKYCIGDYIEIILSPSRHSLCLQRNSLLDKISIDIKFISETFCNNCFPLSVAQTVITIKIPEINKKKNRHQGKSTLFTSSLAGWNHKLYRGVIFHPMCMWAFTLNPFSSPSS